MSERVRESERVKVNWQCFPPPLWFHSNFVARLCCVVMVLYFGNFRDRGSWEPMPWQDNDGTTVSRKKVVRLDFGEFGELRKPRENSRQPRQGSRRTWESAQNFPLSCAVHADAAPESKPAPAKKVTNAAKKKQLTDRAA